MSVQKVSSIPNVYKLEKFVIIDTEDTFDVQNASLQITKPNLLHCYKVYVDIEYNPATKLTQKMEKVNTDKRFLVAVPLNLWQQGSRSGLDDAGNSLICPPYIATQLGNIVPASSLSENIIGNLIHRGSIIYAQRRDYGIDVYGSDGDTRQGSVNDDLLNKTKYIDINADGRSLKITSQTDKSNNVDLSEDQFAGAGGDLTNFFSDTASLTHIESLQKACIINEDAAIDYLLDIDKVTRTDISTITIGNKYELQATNTQIAGGGGATDTNIGFKLVTASSGSGTGTTFTSLTDTDTPSASHLDPLKPFAIVHLSSQSGEGVGDPTVDSVEMSHLNSRHFRGNGAVATLLTINETMKFAVSSIPTVNPADDSKFSCTNDGSTCTSDGVVLRDMSEIVASAGSAKKVVGNASGAGIGDLYFLVASATESKFHQLQYASQLHHVTTSVSFGDDGDAIETVASLTKDTHGQFKIDFKAMSDLLNEGTDVVGGGSNAIGSYFVVKKGENGKLEGAKIGDEAFSGGGGGEGNVKYVGTALNTPGSLKFKNFIGNYDNDIKHLNYTPTLFGICKEDGSYEYRYFLTSAAVTAT